MIAEIKRRVLFLIPTLTGGGAERVIVTLLRHLDRKKFDLSLAVVDTRDAVFLRDLPQDVEFIDLQCSRVRYALPKITVLIWKRKPDVVFSTLGHLNLALAMLRSLLPNQVYWVARETIVVSNSLSRSSLPKLWAWAYRRFSGRMDQLVCQSIDMRDDLIKNFDFPEKKAVVINNPCDIEKVRSLAKEPIGENYFPESWKRPGTVKLVAAGRLVYQKGFDLLIDAVAQCKNPSIHLVILGEGPLKMDLYKQAERSGISTQITFAGFMPNPYIYFPKADAFVLSSRFEGFPNVVLEALACGTPVIATPAPGGIREILESISECIIADAVTAQALASAITAWVSGDMNRVAASAIVPYSVGQIIAQYENLLSLTEALNPCSPST